jgi:hypothetical protein
MRPDSDRWVEVTPSPHPHERAGLEHIRSLLPDADPYRAWSNLEIVTDRGETVEVDLLVLGPAGFYQLRRYVADHDNRRQGFERIVLEAVVEGPAAPPGPWQRDLRKVAFWGRWLVGEPVKRRHPVPGLTERAIWDGDMHHYGVALTKQGKIAVLVLDATEGSEYGHAPRLKVYDSLEEADRDGVWHSILDSAATALNTELVDELDI